MYKVVFNNYCNYSNLNKVSSMKLNEYNDFVDEDGKLISDNGNNYKYLDIPNPFIIREDEIEKYKKYGCGYKSLEYVGSIIEEQKISEIKI